MLESYHTEKTVNNGRNTRKHVYRSADCLDEEVALFGVLVEKNRRHYAYGDGNQKTQNHRIKRSDDCGKYGNFAAEFVLAVDEFGIFDKFGEALDKDKSDNENKHRSCDDAGSYCKNLCDVGRMNFVHKCAVSILYLFEKCR